MESQSQEQSIEQPMLPAPPEPDTVSGSTALVTYDHYDILAHPERDRPEQFQEEVRKLKNRFTVLDTEVRKGGKVVVRGIAQMIPALAEMEPFLSRKGEHHEPHYVKMLVAAGLPTWSEYLAQLAEEFEISVRKIQRRLEEHRGHPRNASRAVYRAGAVAQRQSRLTNGLMQHRQPLLRPLPRISRTPRRS